MQAAKENLKPLCKQSSTTRKSTEDDVAVLTILASEVIKLLNEFSEFQDLEIKQISEYSEESFAASLKL